MPFFSSLGATFGRLLIVVAAVVYLFSEISTVTGTGLPGFSDGVVGVPYAAGVAIDSSGNLYIADQTSHRILKITPTGVVSTLAGGTAGWQDSTGTNARFNAPQGIAVDSAGNVYVGDTTNNRIRKITPAGLVSTLAGSGAQGSSDGTGANATFRNPRGVAVDSSGTVYVADTGNQRIRKIAPDGTVSTLAGSGAIGSADGTGANATFLNPYGVALDSAGNVYVADQGNHRIRKITPGGSVSTLAGSTTGYIDGLGTNARFNGPQGIAVDSAGNVYVADTVNSSIRKIAPDGTVSTLAGQKWSGYIDGVGTNARFDIPWGIAVDLSGNVYVGDTTNRRIRKITPAGLVSTFASYGSEYFGDSPMFNTPFGVATDLDGALYIADMNNHCIRSITRRLLNETTGTRTPGFLDGFYSTAMFNSPSGIACYVDYPSPRFIVADTGNRCIRSVSMNSQSANGVVTRIIGNGTAGFSDNSPQTFDTPIGITIDQNNVLYISDIGNHNIRRYPLLTGPMSTLAGSRTPAFADGVGTNASFNSPYGIVADTYGNVYVADTNNHRIRRINSNGYVTTLAGSTAGYADGTGTNALFNFPYHLSIDPLGTIYVADRGNHRIRKVTPDGVVTTLAGDGIARFTISSFNSPQGITVDQFNRKVYVGDSGNHSIRSITNPYTLPENNGVVSTIAGTGLAQFSDGSGRNAAFSAPRGVGVDQRGNVFVADTGNSRIRRITPQGVVTTWAGGTAGWQDSTGTNARFNAPWGIACDILGNVFVGDSANHRIRKIDISRSVSSIGNGTATFGTDSLNTPQQIVSWKGQIYIADVLNHRIRSFTPGVGGFGTVAGSGATTSLDGFRTAASFNRPEGVAIASDGTIYVAEYSAHRIRRITPFGVVTTFAGTTQGFQDGVGTNARFNFPRGIAVGPDDTIYVADESNHRIRKITPNGVVSTLAGSTQGYQDGVGTTTRFNFPVGITVDLLGNLYIGDRSNNRIRKIGTTVPQIPPNQGVVTTIAGDWNYRLTNGTGTNASFNNPFGIVVGPDGNLYVADANNNAIRRVTPGGVVTTFAGQVTPGFTNGVGNAVTFNFPWTITVDSGGTLYVGDINNNAIRKISPTGVVSTFVGGTFGYADGSGANARFRYIYSLIADSEGNLWVCDDTNHCIRKVTSAGVVTTFAGIGNAANGDVTNAYVDGTGTNARFYYPEGIAMNSTMDLFVLDHYNYRIRKITRAGVVTTFVGNGNNASVDGVGTNASLGGGLTFITIDKSDNMYITERYTHLIRKITPAGVVTTLAGSTSGFILTDGVGTNTRFDQPAGITVTHDGTLYVADMGNSRIRKIT